MCRRHSVTNGPPWLTTGAWGGCEFSYKRDHGYGLSPALPTDSLVRISKTGHSLFKCMESEILDIQEQIRMTCAEFGNELCHTLLKYLEEFLFPLFPSWLPNGHQ